MLGLRSMYVKTKTKELIMKTTIKYVMAVAALAVLGNATLAHANDGGEHKKGEYFAKMDTDKNGVVSKAEFLKQSEERFAKIDGNNDGNLSKEEMQAYKEKMKAMHKEWRKNHPKKDKAAE